MSAGSICELCRRTVDELTRHHLIPRSRHRRKKIREKFSKTEREQVVMLCRPCHKQIHATLSEKELAEKYCTLEGLRTVSELADFIQWIQNKPPDFRLKTYRQKRP